MENIVNRILEIDKQARQLTMNAEDLQAKADVEIAQETKKIQADFEEQAKQQIIHLKEQESQRVETKLQEKETQTDTLLAQLEQDYQQHGADWVKTLVSHVLN